MVGQTGKSGDNPAVEIAGRIDADNVHRLVARVYYADTDFSGAVYHARYLEWLERGRSDFLRLFDVHHTDLQAGSEGETLYWVVRRMEIDFRRAASIDDLLTVNTSVAHVGGAHVIMSQTVGKDDATLISAVVTAALINAEGKPRRFPNQWRTRFEAVSTG
ncbi:MAG: YbgC/FadM family acyl-CoA thioesterase [Pseudomonadota bacterium]